jgi:hypothetical protein
LQNDCAGVKPRSPGLRWTAVGIANGYALDHWGSHFESRFGREV